MRCIKGLLLTLCLLSPGMLWAEGVLTPAANPPDKVLYDPRTDIKVQDDFLGGAGASGQVGTLGWTMAGSVNGIASVANRIGLIRVDTTASSGVVGRLALSPLAGTSSATNPAALTTQMWMLRLNTNDANTVLRFGSGNGISANPPDEGIYFDKLDASTNWFCVTRTGGATQTRTDSGIAIDTSFHTFEWERTSAGVRFLIDRVVVCTQSTNIPTTFITPMLYIINSAAALKSVDVDYFETKMTVTR